MDKEMQPNPLGEKSFREIRYEEKKDLIIKIASKAFGRKGFDSATIEEIANEIRMTKGSLYYYFKTKEELLYEAHLLSLKEVINNITKIAGTSDPPDVKLKNAVFEHIKVLAREFEGAFLLQQEYALPDPYKKEVMALRDFYQAQFEQILQEGIDRQIFYAQHLKIASFCMLGAINWFLRWYSSSGPLTAEEIAEAFVDFFLKGILMRKDDIQGECHGHERRVRRRKNNP